ncbi:DegT/DnrJ/EryC1/StrS family aminotransferase [Devosia oryziradicis]|uniref:DegT/DnrJ/EryC1/StrS family aminotransferase n=1 Tax=Devosia oryziradicis TaxID=2801335 RepID=A0ABX7BUV7_9HYPH|nr:DegT/DnrJ/EryC1/StrS family aminotransferase [Devosia oryziradicis]QQR35327.1 DegT/DnrJ/EryC1/StrS family aminotransferase [Devosia oryziradicis]
MIKFLDLHAQYLSIKEEMDAAIAGVIESSAFIGGPAVREFEASFGNWVGSPHCVGVGNGTDALEIAIEALALPPGSEVILPANSFIATSEAVGRAGLKVVFADVDHQTYVLDPESVRQHISAKTSAIIPVHLYGHPCDMPALMALAAEHELKVIEDCAQAHGARIDGQTVGTIGDFATFSFYPGKNLGAYGDAGAITAKDDALAKRARMIANHGRVAKYEHEFEGRNSRLDGLQAAILSTKLRHLDKWIERRIAVADRYTDRLTGIAGITLPHRGNRARHAYHLFVVRTAQRDALAIHLKSRGIETGIHYPVALPRLAAYANHPQAQVDFFAARMGAEVLSLPMGEHLELDQVDEVCAAIRDFFKS